MHWSDDRVERLSALWDRGLSASRIAAEMAIGRGAVLSKARRLGLKERPLLSLDERMERCIDIFTNADVNEPITLRDAAQMAGIAYKVALGRWRIICDADRRADVASDELVRQL